MAVQLVLAQRDIALLGQSKVGRAVLMPKALAKGCLQ